MSVIFSVVQDFALEFRTVLLGFVLLAVVFRYLLFDWIKLNVLTKRDFPPGPVGLPVLGYIPFLGDFAHLTLIDLAKKYGRIFSLPIGDKRYVVLNDFPMIKKVFLSEASNGRPELTIFVGLTGKKTFVDQNGEPWKEQRRFMLRALRDLGLGKDRMATFMRREIQIVLDKIDAAQGEPIDCMNLIMPATTNLIHCMLFGRRLKSAKDSPDGFDEEKYLIESMENSQRGLNNLNLYVAYPHVITWINKLGLRLVNDMARGANNMMEYFRREMAYHKETLDEHEPRDYMDMFLMQMRKHAGYETTSFDETHLLGNSFNFFPAGADTTTTATSWALTLLALYPEIQDKLQEEVKSVLHSDEHVTLEQRTFFPYAHAVMAETQRWSSFVPTNVNRALLADLDVEDETTGKTYKLPKGTVVVANLWSAHHDPAIWPKPMEFNPDRFLSTDPVTGKLKYRLREELIPFSMGKRACPGEPMAQAEFFTMLVTFMQHYRVTPPKGVKRDDRITTSPGLLAPPANAKLVFTRHQLTD